MHLFTNNKLPITSTFHICSCFGLGLTAARQGGHRVDFLSSKPHLPFWTTFRVGSLEGGQVGKPFVSFHNVHECQCSLFNGKGDFVELKFCSQQGPTGVCRQLRVKWRGFRKWKQPWCTW